MKSICLYFQVHQPFRLRVYRFFDMGSDHHYYDDYLNKSIMQRVARKCYLPANKLMLKLIKKHGKSFKISYSISGPALEQFERYAPEVLNSFKALAATGNVEFLTETYAHSLASLNDTAEFVSQVGNHSQAIERLFGQKPVTFRNTELIYSDAIGQRVYDMGYKTILTEGAKHVLGWKSPNFLYHHNGNPDLKLMLKNFRLSDDIAFRFSDQGWSEWPLTADKYARWISQIEKEQEIVNLFVDYETFGEHQWEESGIFEFMEDLPAKILTSTGFKFRTPSEIVRKHKAASEIFVPFPISWADEERDLTAWLGNEMQNEAFTKLYSLAGKVKACHDPAILRDWDYLQASDHFYYMCTKWFSDGDVHRYFNPYPSPYEAFINYMNVLSDFMIRLDECHLQPASPEVEKPVKKAPPAKKTSVKAPASKFSFGSVTKLPGTRLKKLLKGFEPAEIATVLYGKKKEVKDLIMENLGKTAQKQLLEQQEGMKRPTPAEVKKVLAKFEKEMKSAT
ncbi:MAG: alpha-amylase [Bacteroidales bacterium]|nr:alpha-amylase [Bacteroidales bacterium]